MEGAEYKIKMLQGYNKTIGAFIPYHFCPSLPLLNHTTSSTVYYISPPIAIAGRSVPVINHNLENIKNCRGIQNFEPMAEYLGGVRT